MLGDLQDRFHDTGCAATSAPSGFRGVALPSELNLARPFGRAMSGQFRLFGVGSDNGTFSADLYLIYRRARRGAGGRRDVFGLEWALAASFNATLGSTLGADADDSVGPTERFADTITIASISARHAALETAYDEGELSVYSPADNTVGLVVAPNLLRAWGYAWRFHTFTNVTLANALFEGHAA